MVARTGVILVILVRQVTGEDYTFSLTIRNVGGYSSYDYAAVIREDRRVDREKYSEAKLLASFVESVPAYITATPGNLTNGTYTDTSALSVTPLFGNGSNTNFYVIR